MNTKTIALATFIFISHLFFGQTAISGQVTFKGKPLKEISVTLKDSYDGATTDTDGNYVFETNESGTRVLIFSSPHFMEIEKEVRLGAGPVKVSAELKEQISEIAAVVISAGSIEASDRRRANVLLTPLDIYTTAGANGQVTAALETLPGVQKIGETEGLFVRGGTGTETKFFMDGNLVNNFFANSVPGIKSMDRLNTSLFKGNVFSSGGYSALYGQALSSVLLLESIDFQERNSVDVALSPLFLNGGFQRVDAEKTRSFGISAGYSNLGLMTRLIQFNNHFTKAPESFGTNLNFRFKTPRGGMLKYYGSFDKNKIGLEQESLESPGQTENTALKGKNTFHNLSFRQKMGSYVMDLGSSFTYNLSDLSFNLNHQKSENSLVVTSRYLNAKATLERRINRISAVRGGLEYNETWETTEVSAQAFPYQFNDKITSVFAETDIGLSNDLSAKAGLRAEYSSVIGNWNVAPRFAMAYRLSKTLTSSLAYGVFYQNPENKFFGHKPLDYQQATHYVFQVQQSAQGRSLRLEAFYKDYSDLIKTKLEDHRAVAVNNFGSGYAKGIELYWRDKASLKNIDYWISYSFLDSKREFQNYTQPLFPDFAAKHNLSVVAKKFVTEWKTGFNFSYTYASGRPYYDFQPDSAGNYHLRRSGKTREYNALNFSINYLPNLGKKDSKVFTVLVLAINNMLHQSNNYGYQFSSDGERSRAILPSTKTFVFIGAFISFGVDRTQDAINSNL